MNYFCHESSYVDEGVDVGDGTKIWHFSHIQSGVRIGKNCVFGQNVNIGPGVVIGDNVKIQNNVSVYEGIIIEDNVFVGPSAVFTNVLNPRSEVNRKDEFSKTIVRMGVSIGANSTIVCGNTLGSYCFVGAGAVVTNSVKSHALVIGVPAKQAGWVSASGEVLGKDLVCPRTGTKYTLKEGDLIEVH